MCVCASTGAALAADTAPHSHCPPPPCWLARWPAAAEGLNFMAHHGGSCFRMCVHFLFSNTGIWQVRLRLWVGGGVGGVCGWGA